MSDGITEAWKNNKNKKVKVFLGGTCNDSTWREELIPKLKIDHFNPVVKEWNDEAYKEELRQRDVCDFLLYVITPKMTGVYSIAEVIDDCWSKRGQVLFCFLEKERKESTIEQVSSLVKVIDNSSYYYFNNAQQKSLIAVGNMVERRGGIWLKDLNQVVDYLNKLK